jgi:murein DD-endopeptidase MepM/ murein hydrolase activator NlpD
MVVLGSFTPPSSLEVEKTVVYENTTPITTQKSIRYPIESYTLTQGFSVFHPGVDLAAPLGTPVYPIREGVVEDVSASRYAYGNAVLVNHGDGITSLYAHLSFTSVSPGDKVTTLTKLGGVGATGHATGPHLHLEVRRDNTPINPFAVLPSPASVIN